MVSPELHPRRHDADPCRLHLRAYAEPVTAESQARGGGGSGRRSVVAASEWVLVFDTETTTCPAQRCRFGFYQLRQGGRLDEEAAFYDGEALSAAELTVLRRWCSDRGLPEPMTLEAFREGVFLGKAYPLGATVVGFNLPFDLSRIALRAAPARVTRFRQKMRGGFTLIMSERPEQPNVQVKHLNPRASLIEFSSPGTAAAARSRRKRQDYTPAHRGAFLDVKTAAATLLSGSHSLASLTAALETPTRKAASEEHGGDLTDSYIDYARGDVQATWECFRALQARYTAYGLDEPLHALVSEAGLGKAMLRGMGVRPWREVQPDYAPASLSRIQSTYFGGRTEVRIRRRAVRVLHTDFTSMYPTVCTLQGLWRFIIAGGFRERDATEEVRAFLAHATAETLRDRSSWPKLAAIVRIRPDRTLIPVRTAYEGELHATIGLNHLTADFDVWITLADCIAAKLLSGRAPVVLEAIAFDPLPPQEGLRPMRLFGEIDFDPYADDLFKVAICRREALRREVKARPGEKDAIEIKRQNLKILANSTSYGIFMQQNVARLDEAAQVRVHRSDGSSFLTSSQQSETPGPFSNPLIATLITGAARLLLALAEREALDRGLEWAFCDTDSLSIAQPEGMADSAFLARAEEVVASFSGLNPYDSTESVLKVEDYNLDGQAPRPLYCYAVSSKRYALFNLDADGRPELRKASAHGLGHLLSPYRDGTPVDAIPAPRAELSRGKEYVPQWQHDLWFAIIRSALHDRRTVPLDWHPALASPCASRYGANTPELRPWMDSWNDGRSYAEQVKPFGFLLSFHARRLPGHSDAGALLGVIGIEDAAPIAPFTRDLAAAEPFDRRSGRAVASSALQTYADALVRYPYKPESKFRGGEAYDSGSTERRHILATGVLWIGKEAEHAEQPELARAGEAMAIRYGDEADQGARIAARLLGAAERLGDVYVARKTGLPRAALARLRAGRVTPLNRSPAALELALGGLRRAVRRKEVQARARQVRLERVVAAAGGLRAAARALGVDASNLAKLMT